MSDPKKKTEAPKPETFPLTEGGQMTAPKPRRRPDVELQTMAKIDALLADLDLNAADRVLAWLNGKQAERIASETPNPELLT
jgi:hypothetical protein